MLNTDKNKKLLLDEKARLEAELRGVGEINPDDTTSSDWVATPPPDITHEPDQIDAADAIEDYVERMGVEKPLEEQLNQVKLALANIEAGTYGTCTVGGTKHEIEPERLDANPSATTCVAHMNQS